MGNTITNTNTLPNLFVSDIIFNEQWKIALLVKRNTHHNTTAHTSVHYATGTGNKRFTHLFANPEKKMEGERDKKGITHYIHYRNTTSNDFQSKDWNYLLNATTRVHVLSCRSFADITSLQIINLKNSYILNLCNFGCIPFVLFAGITEWMRQDYFFLLTSLSAALPIAIYIQQPRKNATHLSLCPEA